MTMPGEQNPHWEAPAATKQSAHCCLTSGASPSCVVTLFPTNLAAGCAHETTAFASTITVHAPHDPSGAHPSLTDVTPQPTRRRSRRLAPSSTSTDMAFPLRVKSIPEPLTPCRSFVVMLLRIQQSVNSRPLAGRPRAST